jgi:HTH-type transcriptional repressor of NAD biosynthesis genes
MGSVDTMKFGLAVVIGKFYPPHHGHKLLVQTALAGSSRVVVMLGAKPSDTIPGELRAQWLREIHPDAEVVIIDDRDDVNDPNYWAAKTIALLGRAPDAVFTSEDYGEPYARAMGCVHIEVDRARIQVPCSGTAVRADPYAQWQFLDPPVRAWFSRRVCLVGAESTGKTTLSEALAGHYQTRWVPEYGREYSALKQERGETEWTTEEFVHIAAVQNEREDLAAREANRVLICDTNAFATWLWHRRYTARDDEAIRVFGRVPLRSLPVGRRRDPIRARRSTRRRTHPPHDAAMVQGSAPSTARSVARTARSARGADGHGRRGNR